MTPMTTPTLQDDAARRTITTATGVNLFVEAGAGSGKTHLLVQRLITLIVEEGVPVNNIAAITFTEKAAGELAERLRTALESIAGTGVHDSGISVRSFTDTDTARRNARAALEQLPAAAIETLHAFCLRIITLHPLEAGVPPIVKVASDFTALVASDDLAAEFLALCDDTISGAAPDLTELPNCRVDGEQFAESLAALSAHGDWLNTVRDRIRWMDEHWGDLGPTIDAPLVRPEPITAHDVDDYIRRLRELLRNCTNTEDRFALTVASCLNDAEELLAHDDPAPESLKPPSFSRGRGGRKADWDIPIDDARDRFQAIGDEWTARYNAEPAFHVTVLRHVMACHVLATAQRRINGGTLDYHDLIYVADRLLTPPPASVRDIAADTRGVVRNELHRRFTHLLIDEFQDTDPAQLRIITAIAGDGGDPRPGRLFTVGDPKQSIYRFRRADIDSYLAARQAAATGQSELVELTTNFRSSAPVITWVNDVFGELFTDGDTADGTRPTVPFAELSPRPDAPTGNCGVVVMNNNRDNVDELTPGEAENRDIVAAVRAALAGQWLHHPRGKGQQEPAPLRLRDIAVLAVTHKAARATMSALRDAGIPHISENSSLVYRGTEIVDLHTVLRAISDPADEFTVAAALRTSLLGCSDKDLVRWREDGNRFFPHHRTDDGDSPTAPSPVEAGLTLLGALATATTGVPVGRAVAATIDALNMDAVAAAVHPDPTPALHRIRTVRDNAHDYGREVGGDLRGYLEWADTQAVTSSRMAEPVIDDTGGDVDAVRVLTVHGAKGREFPMVILAGLSGQKPNHTPDIGLNPDESGRVAMRLSATCPELRTPDWETWSRNEKTASESEWIRLLYVAATRAESVLVVPVEPKLTKAGKAYSNCYGHLLHELLDPGTVTFPRLADVAPAPAPGGTSARTPDDLVRRTREVDAAVSAATSRPGRAAVTGLAHGDHAFTDLPDDYPATTGFRLTGAPVSKDHGTAFGTAVHRVMERVTEHGDVGELAAGAARLGGLSERETASVRAAAESFLSSPLIRRALAGEHHRELPVAGRVGAMTVDGVVDLIYRDDDGWVILDYKTDAGLSATTVDEYFRQLALYAHLIGDRLGSPVTRLELAVARRGQPEIITRHRAGATG